MNTNNSAFTRLENSFADKPCTPSSKDEKDLYQSVLHKHYQIIQTFLEKINSLYIKNQEFQVTLNSIQERLEKIESTNGNIHYEFRTTHLMMDKRLNSMMADFNNINEQIKIIRSEFPAESYLSTQSLLAKSTFLRSRKANNRGNKDQNSSLNPKITVNGSGEYIDQRYQLKAESSWNLRDKAASSLHNFNRLSQTCKVIFPEKIASPIDGDSEESSQKQLSCKQQEEEKISEVSKSKIGVILDKQWVQDKISRQMDEFTIKLNFITEQWNEEKQKMKEQMSSQKYFALFDAKIDEKLNEIKGMICSHNEKLRKEVENVNEACLKKITALQQKLAHKVQSKFFEESMNNLSSAVSMELASHQSNFSNKYQTQRAFRFLENKINKIVEEGENLNSEDLMKRSKPDRGPYLRVNKCPSQKKTDFSISQKQITPKYVEFDSPAFNHKKRSLYLSSGDMDKLQNVSKPIDLKPTANSSDAKSLNWNSISSEKLETVHNQPESKIVSSSVSKGAPSKYRSSYSNFVADERVKEKEWKEKVVKILNVGDRKRVKVTFH